MKIVSNDQIAATAIRKKILGSPCRNTFERLLMDFSLNSVELKKVDSILFLSTGPCPSFTHDQKDAFHPTAI